MRPSRSCYIADEASFAYVVDCIERDFCNMRIDFAADGWTFQILKKLNDNMYFTRNIHQFIGESFPRHAMTLVCRISIDKNAFAIISKSVVPPTNDAQHLVWTDECFMWKFVRHSDAQNGFDISIRGKYGSTSAVAGNRLPMLESYFQLVDWESLVIRPLFDFTAA